MAATALICPVCQSPNCNVMISPVPAQPTALVCDATGNTCKARFEVVKLCDDNGPFWRIVCVQQPTGDPAGVSLTYDYSIDFSSQYTPVGNVRDCDVGDSDAARLDSDPVVLCDDNGEFVRHYTKDTFDVVTFVDTDLAGLAYLPVGNVTSCAGSSDNVTINEPTHQLFSQQYGPGIATLPVAGPVRSLTLTVLTGNVTVVTQNGTGFVAPTTSSFSWGQAGDLDLTSLQFTGDATANFIIHGEV